MNLYKTTFVLLLLFFFVFACISCSNNANPVQFETEEMSMNSEMLMGLDDRSSDRQVIAIYDAVIDVESETFKITPSERMLSYHFPLNALYPNTLTITGFGFSPEFWADLRLSHPLPGSGIDGFDPRVIALLPIGPDNSFNYPELECRGNDAVVFEPDGYTKLFDHLAPSIEGDTNPFLAYFRHQPYRVFSSTDETEETRRWHMDLSGFGGSLVYSLVVDISTKFPAAPQPIIDNSKEPVNIFAEVSDGITPDGGNATVTAIITDWQGPDGISPVYIECPDLFNGAVELDYDGPGENPYEYIFSTRISNALPAGEGFYPYMIAAFDDVSNIAMYQQFQIAVQYPKVLNPIDITPPQLNFSPYDVCEMNGLAFVAAGVNGLHIFDVSDPHDPQWLKKLNIPGQAHGLYAENGFVFVAAEDGGLHIVDVDPLRDAQIVKTVVTNDWALDVMVRGEYAYVADSLAGLTIIDLNPLETAHIVGNSTLLSSSLALDLSGDFAFVVSEAGYLHMVNISDPYVPAFIRTITLSGFGRDVSIYGNYAYVACWEVDVVNITNPASAYIINSISTPGFATGIDVVNGYAFVADWDGEFITLDISQHGSEFIMDTLITPGDGDIKVHAYGDYACVVDEYAGLNIVDISPPTASYVSGWVFSPGETHDCFVSEGYAYVGNDYAGMMLMDIDPIEDSYSIWPHDTPDSARAVAVRENFVYVADHTTGLVVFEILTPGELVPRKTINFAGHSVSVKLYEGYAFVAALDYGLRIIDIEPLNSAYVYYTLTTPGLASDVYIHNGYAYVADGSAGLQIVDIDPFDFPFIVKNVPTSMDANAVTFRDDGYAFVADFNAGVKIIDVDPILDAHVVNTVYTSGSARGIALSENYLFVPCWDAGLQIIDVADVNSPSIVETLYVPGHADGIFVDQQNAYVCAREGGLRIFSLWE